AEGGGWGRRCSRPWKSPLGAECSLALGARQLAHPAVPFDPCAQAFTAPMGENAAPSERFHRVEGPRSARAQGGIMWPEKCGPEKKKGRSRRPKSREENTTNDCSPHVVHLSCVLAEFKGQARPRGRVLRLGDTALLACVER